MCYDTERVNTGRHSGVAFRIKQLLEKEMLDCPCRRHVYEIFLGTAFHIAVEFGAPTEQPTIKIFERFKKQYYEGQFDQNVYDTINGDKYFQSPNLSKREINDLVTFSTRILPTLTNSRNEYQELCKLVIILLTPAELCQYKIQAPGAYNRARFMNRIIYSIKIYLYRKQFDLDIHELTGIQQFILFILKCYLKPWLETPFIEKAPKNDIEMIQNTRKLAKIIPNIVDAVLKKVKNHLWYLSHINVAFAFFDDNVSNREKREMIQNLRRPSLSNPRADPNRRYIEDIIDLSKITLANSVSSKTKVFFKITGIAEDFLKIDPENWHESPCYLIAQKNIRDLVCVNDPAERSIALYQAVKDRSNNEVGKHNLVQVVEKSRSKFKKLRKMDILEAYAYAN